jgi:outer membrane protein OmpA-like peptidoglycan-associated protein
VVAFSDGKPVSTVPENALNWMLRPASDDGEIDRKALASLLLEVARNLKPAAVEPENGIPFSDQRLNQLRTLLVGQEIEVLSRLSGVVEDPEQLAEAVSRVLPTAIAQASGDARLGRVLVPALEKATESSIRANPRTLVDLLHPVIVPAIRKSIGESIDETFQSFNDSLKHSLTLRGLKWRWEAWRSGLSFAEVVLRHTLVFQVEHVFLIHRHSGLMISHVTAENAASQDPQLVSSMLVAIQDFVRDSFTGTGQEGLDTLRLGELRLWSEQGQFATLVAVIRGNPPENLRDKMREVLRRIHVERHQALEEFAGDSAGFADVDAWLREIVYLVQQAAVVERAGNPWPIVWAWACVVLLIAGAWIYRWWRDEQLWQTYVSLLQKEPGIVVTDTASRGGKFTLNGLRDPLATDPQTVLRQVGIDASRVVTNWAPYEGLDPEFVRKRLETVLEPPAGVSFTAVGNRIVAHGSAPAAWLERARAASQMLPAGGPVLDLSGMATIVDEEGRRWDAAVARLRAEPGIVITQAERHDGKFVLAGLRDPLATDPLVILRDGGFDGSQVEMSFAPYQGLDPQFVLKRLTASIEPPPTVTLAIKDDHIVAQGEASAAWLDRARIAGRLLPVGAPPLDLTAVANTDDEATAKRRAEIAKLRQDTQKLREAIQSHYIRFAYNVSLPLPGQDAALDELAGELKELSSLAANAHVVTRVQLTGNSDSVGQGTFNLSLSLARAEAVRALLKKRGVDPDLLQVRGAGQFEPLQEDNSEAARSANRRVSFAVAIEEQS